MATEAVHGLMRSGAAAGHEGYFHETAFYGSDEELLAIVVPFLRGGQEAGEPTLVTLNPRNTATVTAALGETAGIDFVAGDQQYRTPAQTIADYRGRFAALVATGARQIRVVGDVPHPGTGGCWHAWSRYEAVVNRAYDAFPLWGMCPYDTRCTPDEVLLDVARTHPHVATADGAHHTLASYEASAAFLSGRPAVQALPSERGQADLELADPTPQAARHAAAALAAGHLGDLAAEHLQLALSEVVTNAHLYGSAPIRVRAWVRRGQAIVRVDDAGPGPDDPLVGLVPQPRRAGGGAGVGLWIAHQICTDVAIDVTPAGCSVRLVVQDDPERGLDHLD